MVLLLTTHYPLRTTQHVLSTNTGYRAWCYTRGECQGDYGGLAIGECSSSDGGSGGGGIVVAVGGGRRGLGLGARGVKETMAGWR